MKFPQALCLLPLFCPAAGPLHSQENSAAPAAADDGSRKLMAFVRVDVVSVSAPAK